MVRFTNTIQFANKEHMELFLKSKETDCVLYSKEGMKFNVHREILGQTKFLRDILLSSKESCCKDLEIFCPCSKSDLEHMIKFLYSGGIVACNNDSFRILENLIEVFGFPKEHLLPKLCLETENDIRSEETSFEFILAKETGKKIIDNLKKNYF